MEPKNGQEKPLPRRIDPDHVSDLDDIFRYNTSGNPYERKITAVAFFVQLHPQYPFGLVWRCLERLVDKSGVLY